MESAEVRKRFLTFFEKNGHTVVPSSSLVPDDASVLLTTAGMQQFKKYYTGELNAEHDFHSKNTASVQKCFRTSDIDEVGDETHLTFFEMLGNFSFGGYFKDKAIALAHEFITKELGLKISYVTIFKGSNGVSKDEEAKKIWNDLGIKDVREEGMEDVFWGPTGTSGPCGPTTEIYCTNAQGKDVEIWNIVFNEFFCTGSREELLAGTAKLEPLKTKGIDTGMGLERLVMISQSKKNIFDTDLFIPTIDFVEKNISTTLKPWSQRIIADHVRGITFLIADGVLPSNRSQGYILRRLMRRAMAHFLEFQLFEPIEEGKNLTAVHEYHTDALALVTKNFINQFSEAYPYLIEKQQHILNVIKEENEKFSRTYRAGNKILREIVIRTMRFDHKISGEDIFNLVTTYGLSLEWIKDVARKMYSIELDLAGFEKEFKKHQELSRAGAEKKFGGHGLILDTGELKAGNEEELKKVLALHTATHLLQGALREVFGPEVHQLGSDITPERTRFDFNFSRKLTAEEIKKVEDIVNKKIKEDLPVGFKEMSKDEAENVGALHFFKEKYPEKVKVYYIGKTLETAWSKEFCGGPHVTHTGEIGHFKIAKEEAVGAGVRRIRGVVDSSL